MNFLFLVFCSLYCPVNLGNNFAFSISNCQERQHIEKKRWTLIQNITQGFQENIFIKWMFLQIRSYSNDLYITVNIYTSSVDTNHLMCYIHTVTHYQYYGWWMSSHIFIAFLWTEYCLFGKILRANKYWWHSNRKALFRLSSQSE